MIPNNGFIVVKGCVKGQSSQDLKEERMLELGEKKGFVLSQTDTHDDEAGQS